MRKQITSTYEITLEYQHSYIIVATHPSNNLANSNGFYICSTYNFNNDLPYMAVYPVKEATNISFTTESSAKLSMSASQPVWLTIIDLGSRMDEI